MGESLMVILLVVGIGALVILAIKYTRNSPTLEGIAISALLGMLPLYLVLCFFGIMGEGDEEDEEFEEPEEDEDEQSEPSD
jgi:hypothetical protein